MATTSSVSSSEQKADAPDPVRAVSDTEVSFFKENGWVLLRGLVAPELCRAMLERGKPRLEGLMKGSGFKFSSADEQRAHMTTAAAKDEGTLTDIGQWIEWRGCVRAVHDPVFSKMALAKTTGRNVQRLLGREKAVRIYHDMLVCKLPDKVSTPTDWHQDSTAFGLDRNVLTMWIALEEVTPEQGPVLFYSGSHRCGLLGTSSPSKEFDLVDEYPELARFPVSPAHHLQPGDCTVHHGLVVHGANANNTPNPRWSYIASYFPADTRYTGVPNHDTDGFGLKQREIIDHPAFPQVPQ